MKKAMACGMLMLGLLAGCGTEPLNTRAFEERTLAMGESQKLFRYGNDLLSQGRYREALAAFTSCEQQAYTDDLRAAARIRRMWLQDTIAAHEAGQVPPPPPVIVRDPTLPGYSADLPAPAVIPPVEELPPLPQPGSAPGPGRTGGFRETPLSN